MKQGDSAVPKDLQIVTQRLTLVACSLGMIEALIHDRTEAEQLLGAKIPADWPDAELAELLPLLATQLRENPAALGYGVWLLVESEGRAVVGSAGLQGLPNAEGEVEIGYGVQPDYRNCGYATEAVRAITGWVLSQEGVNRVTAHCEPDNRPSLRVLSKTGLVRAGERKGLTRWVTEESPQACLLRGPTGGRSG